MRLFHISEVPSIRTFVPRPSPSYFENLTGDVVFAICDRLLHNYLLPRDCPRVTFYASERTTQEDREKFFGKSEADFVVTIESGWQPRLQNATLYCYEFSVDSFVSIDESAGYFISYKTVTPLSVQPVTDIEREFQKRKVELRVMPLLGHLAEEVRGSTLEYSLIRMRNALKIQ